MTTKKKLLVAGLIVVVSASTVGYSVFARNRGVIGVQSGKVARQDLTQTVSANGEIKPKKYVNVSSNMMGRIVHMPVKEGDRVRNGDLLVQLESIQTEADVRAAEASLDAAQADVEGMVASIRSADAAVTSAKAEITRAEADLVRAKQNFERQTQLNKEGLIARDAYEKAKADYEIAEATVNSDKARLAQSEAQAAQVLKQRDSTATRIAQQRAALTRAKDVNSKATIRSTLDGIITYLPVNEGEIAIVGVQNQPGTVL
ncbi:MAG TPA: biotin/lipoyl-binding protein, partial [Terriglobia bacterium]|nr:biotin/lipoyl-binding protein [Terriglobia bacterium]